jgi:hypothetical protein
VKWTASKGKSRFRKSLDLERGGDPGGSIPPFGAWDLSNSGAAHYLADGGMAIVMP